MIACRSRFSARNRAICPTSALCALWLGAALAPDAATAAGAIDPRFGSGGQVPMAEQYILDVVPTSADRMLVLSCPGNAWEYSCYNSLLLRRFTAHGFLDPDFGSGATWTLGADGSASAIAQRPDGSLLVAGRLDDGSGFVAAATASGQRDPVFGGQSVLRLTQPVRALAVQVDGKLLVGTVPDNANFAECPGSGWTLQRLSASGAIDQTFGAGGSVTSLMIDGAEERNCELTKIWTEPSGDLVVQTAVGLRRLRGDGSLDTTFGSADGVAATHGTVTRTADGGFLDIALASSRWVAQRFNSDGRNDPTFGSGGRIDLDVPGMLSDFGTIDQQFVERFAAAEDGQHYYASVFVQGRLKSTGELQSGTFIVRFLADGAVDTAYGVGGKVQMGRAVQLGNRGLFTQSDGKLIVAAGGAIYRLLAGDEPSPGIVSAAFADPVPVVEGGRARVVVSRTAGDSTAISVRYLIVGQPTSGLDAMPGLDYLPVLGVLSWAAGDDSDRIVEIPTIDDTIDESPLENFVFHIVPAEGAPIITYPYAWIPIADNDPPPATPVPPPGSTPTPPSPAPSPASTRGGKPSGGGGAVDGVMGLLLLLSAALVRAGRAGGRAVRPAQVAAALCLGMVLAHLDANAAGSVDPTFGSSGVLRPQTAIDEGTMRAVPLSGDRLLTVGCPWDYGCYRNLSLRRFSRDGWIDATFGESGVAFVAVYPSSPVIVMERAGGALLLAGDDASTAGFLMAVTASGQPDPVFGGQAVLKLAQPVRALAVQADGKLLVATAPDPTECQSAGWTLQRLSASGVVDPTFGINGATTSLAVEGESGRNCGLTQIWAEPGGPLVIQTSAGLRRLHSEGSLDTTFGTASGVTSAKGSVTRTADGRFLDISGQLAAWSVRRYDGNGREDPTFGSGGVVNLDLAAAMADFSSVAGHRLDRIVVLEGGGRYVASMQIEGRLKSTGEWTSGTFIVRFLSDGRLDAAFGKVGKVQLSRSAVLGNAGLFPQSDGRLIVAAGGAIYRLLSGEAPSPGFVIMGLAEPVPVVEGDRARIVVSRTGGAGTAITVSYQAVAQDALAELDFIPVSGRLSWAAGDDGDRVVEVQTVDDKVNEPNDGYPESLTLRITPAEGAPVITVDEQWIGIADNEPPVAPPAPPPAIPPPPIVPQTLPSGGGGGGAIGSTEAIALLGLLVAGVLRDRSGSAGARARRSRISAHALILRAAQLCSGRYGSARGTVHAGNQPLPGDRDHDVLQ